MLYTLKLGEIVTTEPSIGFNVETLDYKNISFTSWDHFGPNDRPLRPLWRYYYEYTAGIIWMTDSNDRERIDDSNENSSQDELRRMLAFDDCNGKPLLVFANKQDLPNAMSVNETAERLGLYELRNRKWKIQGLVLLLVMVFMMD